MAEKLEEKELVSLVLQRIRRIYWIVPILFIAISILLVYRSSFLTKHPICGPSITVFLTAVCYGIVGFILEKTGALGLVR